MRKNILMAGMMLSFLSTMVFAQEVNTDLKQKLTTYFSDVYTNVDVVDENAVSKVVFPKIDVMEYDEKMTLKAGKAIPSYSVVLKDKGEFLDHKQYEMKIDNLARLNGFIYSNFKINGIEADSFVENLQYVPDINAVTRHDVEIKNAVYRVKDAETGLNKDVAGVSDLKIASSLKAHDDHIEYSTENMIKGVGADFSLFKVNIPMLWSKGKTKYDLGATDFEKMLVDITKLKNMSYVVKTSQMSFDAFGIKLGFDLSTNGVIYRQKDGQKLDFKSQVLIDKINQNLSNDFNLKKIKILYLFQDVATADIVALNKVQEDYEAEQEKAIEAFMEQKPFDTAKKDALEQKMEKSINDIMSGIKAKVRLNLDFDKNATSELWADIKAQDGYMVGNVKMTFVNIEKILPSDKSSCDENKSAGQELTSSCNQNDSGSDIRSMLKSAHRTTQKDGSIVDVVEIKITKEGVFMGKEKISEPVKIDEAKQNLTEKVGLGLL